MPEQEQRPDDSEVEQGKAETELGAEELLDLLQRERASFLNYKRRVEQERATERERGREEVLLRILPLLDELERALAQRPADLQTHPWAQGVALIQRRLVEALRELGVERVGFEGEAFHPEYHEAVFYEERPDIQERRVSAVLRPGYRLAQRLIRPAQVSVVGPRSEQKPADESAT